MRRERASRGGPIACNGEGACARPLTQERPGHYIASPPSRKTAVARCRPGQRPPSCAHPRGLPGHGKPSTAARSRSTQPGQEKTDRPTIRFGLRGACGHVATTLYARHRQSHQARACCEACTRSACYRRPEIGRTADHPGQDVTEQRCTRPLASPCVGASSAGQQARQPQTLAAPEASRHTARAAQRSTGKQRAMQRATGPCVNDSHVRWAVWHGPVLRPRWS